MKTLIVYYSKSRFSEGFAKDLQSVFEGSDLFKIEPVVDYPDDYDTHCERAKDEQAKGILPEIQSLPNNLNEYTDIQLVYPIYYRDAPAVIKTFLSGVNLSGKNVTLNCTTFEGGFGISDLTLSQLVKAKGGNVITGKIMRNPENPDA